MSAFIVEDDLIDLLVTYATSGGPFRVSAENPQKLGDMLVAENYRSVNHRYRESDPPHPYRYHVWSGVMDPVQVIQSCNCFDYQACETDDYRDTPAARLVDNIRSKAIRAALPQMEKAKWGAPPNPNRSVVKKRRSA